MAKRPEKSLIVGLDIGTSKVVAIVGEVNADGHIQIIGVGEQPSRGLKRGVIINIEATTAAIQSAIEKAELMAGCEIHSVTTNISGNHIRGLNSHGVVAIRDKEVAAVDVDRVIEAAKAVLISADQKILHVLAQEFTIDNESGIHEPIGMSGVRLETRVHIVTAAVSAAQNIIKCLGRCQLTVDDIVLSPLAASYALQMNDEKELGVCMIDIGGGTSDMAVFSGGAIRHTAIFPVGGEQVTNDIAVALRTPPSSAEEIKLKYACALARLTDEREWIDVPSVGERPTRQVSQRALAEVVEPRYEELFGLVHAELLRSGYEDAIPAGIILTGASAKTKGLIELAEEIFHLPVRVGLPQSQKVSGPADLLASPAYATAIGLLLYSHMQNSENLMRSHYSMAKKTWDKIKTWFQGSF